MLGHIQNCVDHLKVLQFHIPALNRQAILDLFVLRGCNLHQLRFDDASDAKFLTSFLNKGSAVLQGYSDRVCSRKIASTPANSSLELSHPEDLWWWIHDDGGKRKNRAVFRIGRAYRVRYDLAVIDPAWLNQLNLLPAGIYPHSILHKGSSGKTLLTISLSDPYEGFHYKLVADVINFTA